jgi:hypothetical protein
VAECYGVATPSEGLRTILAGEALLEAIAP